MAMLDGAKLEAATLFAAAAQEFILLYDQGRDLPNDFATACQDTLADLRSGEENADLVQTMNMPTDDGRVSMLVYPGRRLVAQLLRLRQHRTRH